MHPGPINRGREISSEVADSQRSAILNQVENGIAVRMAVLERVLTAEWTMRHCSLRTAALSIRLRGMTPLPMFGSRTA